MKHFFVFRFLKTNSKFEYQNSKQIQTIKIINDHNRFKILKNSNFNIVSVSKFLLRFFEFDLFPWKNGTKLFFNKNLNI
jgi:hypothetical protein